MPATHTRLLFHVIFRIKHDSSPIETAWKDRLHQILGGCVRRAGALPIEIGGTRDHVHLLLRLKPFMNISDVVRSAKSGSSKIVHETLKQPRFRWQEGYGAFTISISMEEQVKAYIRNQEEHHRHKSFQEEYEQFLRKSGINVE
jgi:REP element-mobilizing transposase RayT